MGYYDNNIIAAKSKLFALRCIRLYKFMCSEHKEFVLSKQMLRSGTSIGANIKEALRVQRKADFGAKMNIVLKEANETECWLELLNESDYLTKEQSESILSDCRELLRILTSIVKQHSITNN